MSNKKNQDTKKKNRKVGGVSCNSAIVSINASFNNTIVTVTDQHGSVLSWSSGGKVGFKGSKKSSPHVATIIVKDALLNAKETFSIKTVSIDISGPGPGRESAMRAVGSMGLNITMIKDTTPIPYNGCRPPKRRRV
jgi:small subunit ribosomal protein S11